MTDEIYLMDPRSMSASRIQPASFSDIGIKERSDLQRWIQKYPGLLIEPLLIVSCEFDRFDKTNKRLDMLGLDKMGVLVVVEIKLDVVHTLADLQAIRYAAFCSTMTMESIVGILSDYENCTLEEASEKIGAFLGTEELPELGDHPRIMLVAGSIGDPELTSSVLWLRSFGVDITCVELTPYVLPNSSQIALTPRIIIPLPEAKEYLIGHEKKDAVRATKARAEAGNARFWRAVLESLDDLGPDFRISQECKGTHKKVLFRDSSMHYEWIIRKRDRSLCAAIHFEHKDRAVNQARLDLLAKEAQAIEEKIGEKVEFESWGKRWAHAQVRLPFEGDCPKPEMAEEASALMKAFIEATWPVIADCVGKA